MHRSTDSDSNRTYFRSNRFFSVGTQWYFVSRESTQEGPFESRAKAEEALEIYLSKRTGQPITGWDVPGAEN